MKKSVATLFSLFLLSAFTSCVSSKRIYDTDGEVLKNGGTYLITSTSGGVNRGISLASTGGDTCPLTVVATSKPVPVRISSFARAAFLAERMPILFTFDNNLLPRCVPNPNYWTIVEEEFVKVDKTEENGIFFIEEVGNRKYKITVGEYNIGIPFPDGLKTLVVTWGKPLEVMFQKVDSLSFPSASA